MKPWANIIGKSNVDGKSRVCHFYRKSRNTFLAFCSTEKLNCSAKSRMLRRNTAYMKGHYVECASENLTVDILHENCIYIGNNQFITDKEIKTYVSDRFGAFSDYRPAFEGSNYLLWFGPFIFLALMLIIFFIKRRV